MGKDLECSQREQDCTVMLTQIKVHRVFFNCSGISCALVVMEATLAVIIFLQYWQYMIVKCLRKLEDEVAI